MLKLTCVLCGGTDFIRTEDGLFKCRRCGCGYTLEQAQNMLHMGAKAGAENAGLECLLNSAKTLVSQKRYVEACSQYQKITFEYPDEARGWFGLVEAAMTQIFDKKVLGLMGTMSDPLNVIGLGVWYPKALQYADSEKRGIYQRYWNDCWAKIDSGIHSGELTLRIDDWSFDEYLERFAACSPIAASLVKEGKANAEMLKKSGVRWGFLEKTTDRRGWLPYNSASRNCILRFVLGAQIEFIDVVPYSDCYHESQIFPEPVRLDAASVQRYQKEAKMNGKALSKQNICPYCKNRMKPSFFGKTCSYCGNSY